MKNQMKNQMKNKMTKNKYFVDFQAVAAKESLNPRGLKRVCVDGNRLVLRRRSTKAECIQMFQCSPIAFLRRKVHADC